MTRAEKADARRQLRRAERREANRTRILDAAEQVFGRFGLHGGSMRDIAAEAGFSSAAIYLFFENREHLLAETLNRRADELIALVEATIAASPGPLLALHAIIDETLMFHDDRRDFWRMLSQVRTGLTVPDVELGQHAAAADERFVKIQVLLADLMRSGQKQGTIRRGDPQVLTRFFMVLNNEYINMSFEDVRGLSATIVHAFIDDAFGSAHTT